MTLSFVLLFENCSKICLRYLRILFFRLRLLIDQVMSVRGSMAVK